MLSHFCSFTPPFPPLISFEKLQLNGSLPNSFANCGTNTSPLATTSGTQSRFLISALAANRDVLRPSAASVRQLRRESIEKTFIPPCIKLQSLTLPRERNICNEEGLQLNCEHHSIHFTQ
ncbi:MAG: hypothetical protein ACTS6P_01860 [Candidatus Hodgkinia cicadicola]